MSYDSSSLKYLRRQISSTVTERAVVARGKGLTRKGNSQAIPLELVKMLCFPFGHGYMAHKLVKTH